MVKIDFPFPRGSYLAEMKSCLEDSAVPVASAANFGFSGATVSSSPRRERERERASICCTHFCRDCF